MHMGILRLDVQEILSTYAYTSACSCYTVDCGPQWSVFDQWDLEVFGQRIWYQYTIYLIEYAQDCVAICFVVAILHYWWMVDSSAMIRDYNVIHRVFISNYKWYLYNGIYQTCQQSYTLINREGDPYNHTDMAAVLCIKFRANLFWGGIKIYLYFLSLIGPNVAYVFKSFKS